jgi:putative ABC transport system ATP-binding protein
LADEPTGNLDQRSSRAALALIRQTCHENNAALLIVSHDREALSQFEHVQQFTQINQTFPKEVAA